MCICLHFLQALNYVSNNRAVVSSMISLNHIFRGNQEKYFAITCIKLFNILENLVAERRIFLPACASEQGKVISLMSM